MTELIWQGKYDENGKRTVPLRVSLPFQTVETVETINESTIKPAHVGLVQRFSLLFHPMAVFGLRH